MNKLIGAMVMVSMIGMAGLNAHAKAKEEKRKPSSAIQGTITAQENDEEMFLMISGPAAAQIESQLQTKGKPQQIKVGVRCFGNQDVSMQVLHSATEPLHSANVDGGASHCVIQKFLNAAGD